MRGPPPPRHRLAGFLRWNQRAAALPDSLRISYSERRKEGRPANRVGDAGAPNCGTLRQSRKSRQPPLKTAPPWRWDEPARSIGIRKEERCQANGFEIYGHSGACSNHVSYLLSRVDETPAFEKRASAWMVVESIRGWAAIHESDMLLIPRPQPPAIMDPFRRNTHAGDVRRQSGTRSPNNGTSATPAGSPRRRSCT